MKTHIVIARDSRNSTEPFDLTINMHVERNEQLSFGSSSIGGG